MNSDGFITFEINNKIKTKAITTELLASIKKAQKKLDAQIIKDCNYYVPLKSGALQKSAIIHTKIGSGIIVWRTPYARQQYYGVSFNHSQQHNPNACAKWFETAKARKMEAWGKLVNDTIKNS